MSLPSMPTMSSMSSMPSMTKMPSMGSRGSAPISQQSTYGLTIEEIEALKKQGVDFGTNDPYYNNSPTLTYASGLKVPVGQAKFLADYPVNSLIDEQQLQELLKTPGFMDIEDYSSKDTGPFGGSALFWDQYDPNKKGGHWVNWSPERETKTSSQILEEYIDANGLDKPLLADYVSEPYSFLSEQDKTKAFEGWAAEDATYAGEGGSSAPSSYSRNTGKYKVVPKYYGDIVDKVEDEMEEDSEGLFGDGPLGIIASVASMIPGPWQVPAMLLNGANALSNDDPFGAIMSFAGAAGFSPTSFLGDKLAPALGSMGSKIASNAIMGGIGSAVRGGDVWKGALSGGVSGGLGQLGSTYLPSDMKWLASPLANIGSQLASSGKVDWSKALQSAAASSIRTPTTPTTSGYPDGTIMNFKEYKGTKQ